MCLDYKEKFEPCKVGFKVVKEDNNKLFTAVQGNGRKPLRRGVWLNEEAFRSQSYIGRKTIPSIPRYPFGFHIFHTLEGAENFKCGVETIVKVKVKEPVATGLQGSAMVTVAKQIRILPNGI